MDALEQTVSAPFQLDFQYLHLPARIFFTMVYFCFKAHPMTNCTMRSILRKKTPSSSCAISRLARPDSRHISIRLHWIARFPACLF